MKRPDGSTATGLLNPVGFGSTVMENASTDTVQDCANFDGKMAAKDIWGIDSEGIVVDKEGNFWICEEGGPTIWKLNPNGLVLKRFTPYGNLIGAQTQDIQIDTVFKCRKNNRGFEGISITPNGKIYAIIQSPLLYPNVKTGENTQVHRILEINPTDNSTRMFVYLNEGIIGASGSDQIRLRDWKIGDMAAINDHEFLVIEAATRGISDSKKIYKIDINAATPVKSGLYGGMTLEGLEDASGLYANGIQPVSKLLFLDLLANGWIPSLEKSEGLAIVNDSTIVVCNDNDYGQTSPTANGVAIPNNAKSHLFVFGLSGANKLMNYVLPPSFTPEIDLTGNNELINNNDSIPSIKDNTHFGNVGLGSTATKAFVIQNAGPVNLSVNAIHFTGENADEFSLLGAPSFPVVIPAAGNLPINIQFKPLQGGTRNAFLTIENNDTDEGMYNVLLEAEAIFSTGMETNSFLSAVKIYPNPVGNTASIDLFLDKQQTISVRIMNIQGKVVVPAIKTFFSNGFQQLNLNTTDLKNGVYFFEILSDTGAGRFKIVVMHE
jgi:hypothetical protein